VTVGVAGSVLWAARSARLSRATVRSRATATSTAINGASPSDRTQAFQSQASQASSQASQAQAITFLHVLDARSLGLLLAEDLEEAPVRRVATA